MIKIKENKKAIILDMDNTLINGVKRTDNENVMILRPNLDELICKLKKAKDNGIDIVLCTTSREEWVNRFFLLKPEFKTLFNKLFTRDNEKEWMNYSEERYPLEYNARSKNINLEYSKPVTTFGYDSILFIDDNKIEEVRLQILFELTENKLEKDVTFFSGFGFYGGSNYEKISSYKKLASQNAEFSKILEEYLETEKNEPGCNMMCSIIDKFINKKFQAGLTLADKDYIEDYKIFNAKITRLKEELDKQVRC